MNDGGPAFPFDIQVDAEGGRKSTGGMSLRDYFAAAALQGIVANHGMQKLDSASDARRVIWAARHAYALATAMLAERENNGTT